MNDLYKTWKLLVQMAVRKVKYILSMENKIYITQLIFLENLQLDKIFMVTVYNFLNAEDI